MWPTVTVKTHKEVVFIIRHLAYEVKVSTFKVWVKVEVFTLIFARNNWEQWVWHISLGIWVWDSKVKILIRYWAVVFKWIYECRKRFLVFWSFWIVKFRKSKVVCECLHILPILILYRQFHQLVCILLMHLVWVCKSWAHIEHFRIVEQLQVILDETETEWDRGHFFISLRFPAELHVWLQWVLSCYQW